MHYWIEVVITLASLSLPLLLARLFALPWIHGLISAAAFWIGFVIYLIGLAGTIQLIRYRSLFSIVAIVWIFIQMFGLSLLYNDLVFDGHILAYWGILVGPFVPMAALWKWRRSRWYVASVVPGIIVLAFILMVSAYWPYFRLME